MENSEILGGFAGILGGILLLSIVLFIAIYVVQGIYLFKLNKLMYGKGTPMAWIPVLNTYLLGKLTVNKLAGWLLIIGMFITGETTTTVNGVETTTTILPEGIGSIVSIVLGFVQFGLFIYAIVKYYKLKKISSHSVGNSVQTEQHNQPIVTPIQQSQQPIVEPIIQPQQPINNTQNTTTNIQPQQSVQGTVNAQQSVPSPTTQLENNTQIQQPVNQTQSTAPNVQEKSSNSNPFDNWTL